MNDFLRPANGRRPWITAVAVLIVVAIIFGGILFALSGQGTEDQTFPTPTISSEPPSQTSTAAPTEGEALQLVSGRRRVSGVAIGYPHSVAGAVSAAVEIWSQAGATLNPDRAAAIGRLVLMRPGPTPRTNSRPVRRTHAAVWVFRPVVTQVPERQSVSKRPRTNCGTKTSDRVTVLLLGYLNTTSPGEGSQTQIGVFPAYMHWANGDWKIEKGKDTDYGDLAEQPGTAAAKGAGWLEFVQ